MKKTLSLTLLLCLLSLIIAHAEQNLLQGVDVMGVKGDTVTVNVNLNADTFKACAYQCDITLPEGISVVADSPAKGAKCAESHIVASNNISDGLCRVVCYSLKNDVFLDAEGDIMSFKLALGKDMANGKYSVVINNSILANPQSESVSDATGKDSEVFVTTKGDANADGVVSKEDAEMVADYFLGKSSVDINIKLADVNNDGKISMSDANGIINIIVE